MKNHMFILLFCMFFANNKTYGFECNTIEISEYSIDCVDLYSYLDSVVSANDYTYIIMDTFKNTENYFISRFYFYETTQLYIEDLDIWGFCRIREIPIFFIGKKQENLIKQDSTSLFKKESSQSVLIDPHFVIMLFYKKWCHLRVG